MAAAEIVTIGTELLLGQLIDTNTAAIARALAGVGVDVHRETSVGDNTERIAAEIRDALGRAEIAICAGGLGPTVDDVTREAVAAATGRTLVLHEPSLRHIEGLFARMGRAMAENNRNQAMTPAGAIVLENPNGSAPGFIVDDGKRVVVALPGPPRELEPMLRKRALPWLVERFGLRSLITTRVLHTIGIAESDVDARIADLFRAGKNPSVAVLATPGAVDVKVTAKAETADEARALIAALESTLRDRLGGCVFGVDDETLASTVGKALRARGWSVAAAESCTAGRASAMIASVAGASDYFRGGIVAYANEAKTSFLGVDSSLIDRYGSVSEEIAAAMAAGVRARMNATIAISVTGVAGPGGGTPEKPVGLVYVGVADASSKPEVRRMILPGDREMVQHRAALAALTAIWEKAR